MHQNPRTHIKEVWRLQASENVDTHPVFCAIDSIVVDSTTEGIKNTEPLPNFDEYQEL